MLRITVPAQQDLWDEAQETFVSCKGGTLTLEHSLVSLSKWESKWGKPFLGQRSLAPEEELDYIRCMTLTQNVSPVLYRYLTAENKRDIWDYINRPMTATTFVKQGGGKRSSERITSEYLYWLMIALNIPFECQKWHLNRLITLIRVCEVKQQKPKKMSKRAIANQNHSLNAARHARHHRR